VENQVLRLETQVDLTTLVRVLANPRDTDYVALIDIEARTALPEWVAINSLESQFQEGTLKPVLEDPRRATIRSDLELSEYELTVRDNRWKTIAPLVEHSDRLILDPAMRGALIASRARETGVGRNNILRYLRIWWQFGQLRNALVPKLVNCGAPGVTRVPGQAKRGKPRNGDGDAGINVNAEVATKLADGARFLKIGRSWHDAYHDTLRLHFSRQIVEDGIRSNVVIGLNERPTLSQFIYWVNKVVKPHDILLAVKGSTKFARDFKPRTGTARDKATGPGAIYQIDATIANIYLRSRLDRHKLVGRPVLYILVDAYSHLIIGFYAGLSGPSWEMAKMAMEMAYTEKVSFCAKYGIHVTEDEWPSGAPYVLTGDRGWDVIGKHAGEASAGLNYHPKNLPPYRPDLKGLVEGRFELIDGHVKWLPGASHGRERGDPKHALDATYTIESFTKLMIQYILHYNRSFAVVDPPSSYIKVDGRIPSPIDIWNYGVRAFGGPQIFTRARVRSNLLHVGFAKETSEGLEFNRLLYVPVNKALEVMFIRVPNRKWRNDIMVRDDPRDVGKILMPIEKGEAFEEFVLHERHRSAYSGWTQEEVAHDLSLAAENKRFADDRRLRSGSKLEAQVAAITASARNEYADIPALKKTVKVDRAERQAEKREISRQEAWTSTITSYQVRDVAPVQAEYTQRPATLVTRPDHLNELRAARAERAEQKRKLAEE
jgi:putative transposase